MIKKIANPTYVNLSHRIDLIILTGISRSIPNMASNGIEVTNGIIEMRPSIAAPNVCRHKNSIPTIVTRPIRTPKTLTR